MVQYVITTQEKETILHSDNCFYWAFISCCGINPLRYTKKGFALKRLKKVQRMYPHLEIVIRELSEDGIGNIVE